MKPLLAHVYEPHRVTFPCYVQPKLNGIRALYQNGCFQSRDELPFPNGLLSHLSEPLLEVFPPSTILDGELYVHGWPLQRINAAVTPVRQQPTEDTAKVEYHVFDVVNPYQSFMLRFDQSFPFPPMVHKVFTAFADCEKRAEQWYADFVSDGYEGMMYRLGACEYTTPKQQVGRKNNPYSNSAFLSDKHNRTFHLLKRKDFQDDEFLILDFRATTGEKGGRGFVMTLRSKSPIKPTFECGGGLSHSEIDHFLQHSPVGRQAKIKYLVLSSDGIPTGNPTCLAIL